MHLARGHLAKSLHDLAKGLGFSGPTNSDFAAIRMVLEATGHCFFQALEALGRAAAEPQRLTKVPATSNHWTQVVISTENIISLP